MSASRVFELRQYTLHPGQRDVLIDLFDREFVESQEDLGIEVVGQFRDRDRPDRFVWLRGFPDMPARHAALSGFYGGPVWAEHKDAANATMIDFDDVLLLRPLAPETTFPKAEVPRAPVGSTQRPPTLVTATLYSLAEPPSPGVLDLFSDRIDPLLAAAGADRLALLQTEPAPNTYTALPVREGEHNLVRFARFDDPDAHEVHLRRLHSSPDWEATQQQMLPHLLAPPHELRLQPTARSLI
jgi:NIPSNAP